MNPQTLPIIDTERLILRLPEQADVPAIIDYYITNREFLKPWEPLRGHGFFTESFWNRHIRDMQTDFSQASAVRLFLFDRERPDEIIGYTGFFQMMQRATWSCILGYSLSQKYQGQGLMTEALESSMEYVFEKFNLHRINANYMPHNRRSAAVLRRLGFVVEGYSRDYLLINGRWEDHVLTSLTNPNWVDPQSVL